MIPEVPLWIPTFFVTLAVCLSLVLPWALRRTSPGASPAAASFLSLGWLGFTGLLAYTGRLHDFRSLPPPMALLLAAMAVGSVLLCLSPWGKQLADRCTFAGLVGLQTFRLPLELVMHQAAVHHLMPPQMSYTGRNFDIVTGITALCLGIALKKNANLSRKLIWLWNILGTALLFNIVTIAILSLPMPFRVFTNEPANVWVTYFPYVWLPCVMVAAAFIGHLLIFRKLLTSQ